MKIILGTPVRTEPKPWLYFEVESIMVNAMEADERARAITGFEGELWVDSGGYQVLKRGLEVSPYALAERYRRIGCDVCLSLDVPPAPSDDPATAQRKFETSYRNWRILRSELPEARIMPVIHVYPDERLFARWLSAYEDAEELAIGGAVPYVLIARGAPSNSRELAMRLFAMARERFGGRLHLLGMGSPSVSATLEILGIDSADSATWRLKAAYGKVVLPGGGERHVTSRDVNFGRRKAREEELEELYAYLRSSGFPLLDGYDDFKSRLRASFEYRALVNAWVILRSRSPPRSAVFKKLYLWALEWAHGPKAREEAEQSQAQRKG
ncbi:tRNA-ribosyltransferase [Thermoproteus tenax]|uniref:tRNA-ribosyltransferase n=1 Tax=Thermoproteus tenax TaxID=2271 RepID=UPI000B177EBE|nr:tRNA-ribosyltransferase [Thermoproteus tenax]